MKKVLRWGLRITLGLVATLVLFHLVENWRGRRAWGDWKTAQEAKGFHYDWPRFMPPEVPDSENFAKAPIVEAAIIGKGPVLIDLKFPNPYPNRGNWRLGQRDDLDAWRSGYQTNNLETTLSVWGPALKEFEVATRRPKCRLPVKYNFPDFGDSGLSILGFRSTVRILRLRALARLESGQTDAALKDVITMVRVSRHLKDEPSLVVQLLDIANTGITLQSVWEGLSTHRWSLTQLSSLQIELEQLDLIRSFHRCIDCERLWGVLSMEAMVRDSGAFARGFAVQPEDEIQGRNRMRDFATWAFFPRGWVYQNMVNSDRFFTERWLPAMDPNSHRVDLTAFRRLESSMARRERSNPYNFMSQMAIPALVSQTKRVAYIQSGVDEAIVACALERYRLSKGAYPIALTDLQTAYLAQVPCDVVNGGPLHYHLNGDGTFNLYSVGWNGTDEGGQVIAVHDDPFHQDLDQGDWAWPQAKK